jgi:hypothetical protein
MKDSAGNVKMYLNGGEVTVDNPTIGGDLSNWDNGYKLAVADEFDSRAPNPRPRLAQHLQHCRAAGRPAWWRRTPAGRC